MRATVAQLVEHPVEARRAEVRCLAVAWELGSGFEGQLPTRSRVDPDPS